VISILSADFSQPTINILQSRHNLCKKKTKKYSPGYAGLPYWLAPTIYCGGPFSSHNLLRGYCFSSSHNFIAPVTFSYPQFIAPLIDLFKHHPDRVAAFWPEAKGMALLSYRTCLP